jgi:hypothetical protein
VLGGSDSAAPRAGSAALVNSRTEWPHCASSRAAGTGRAAADHDDVGIAHRVAPVFPSTAWLIP